MFGGLDSQRLFFILYEEENIVREKVPFTDLPLLVEGGGTPEFNAEIEKICVYRDGPKDSRLFHAFVVFKTANYYYTIERWAHHISLQRSKLMQEVVGNYNGHERKNGFHRETDWVGGKGTVWGVIALLLREQVFEHKFNGFTNNCQKFAALVFKHSNSEDATFHRYQKNLAGFSLRRIKRANNLDLYIEERQSFWGRMMAFF